MVQDLYISITQSVDVKIMYGHTVIMRLIACIIEGMLSNGFGLTYVTR
jgi:hypothetical protein